VFEARPLIASASYTDLLLWSWTDLSYPGVFGQTASTDLNIEQYRDTGQYKAFFRHDQDNFVHIDYQQLHEWAGTPVYLHLHLIPMANAAGNAYFTGYFFFGNPIAELPALVSWTPILHTFPILAADQYIRRITQLAVCPPPGTPGYSSILSVRFARQAASPNDTYDTNKPTPPGTGAANLCLEAYDIHYQRLLVGSEEEYTGTMVANPARMIFDAAWAVGSVYLQLVVKSDGGNPCSFRLWDRTADSAIAGSVVTTSSTSYVMLEVGPLALGAGVREYQVQGKYDVGADEPKLGAARFVVR
jgi:hypothetical protein